MKIYIITLLGVFPADKMKKFIDFKQTILKTTEKCPFLIANTEGSRSMYGEH